MKTQLWKRILFESIKPSFMAPVVNPDALRSEIIKSHVLYSSVTSVPESDPMDWTKYQRLAVPFDKFFVEGLVVPEDMGQPSLWGAMCQFDKADSHFFGYRRGHVTTVYGMPGGLPLVVGATVHICLNENLDLVLDPTKCPLMVSDFGPKQYAELRRRGCDYSYERIVTSHLSTPLADVLDLMMRLTCKNVDLEAVAVDEKVEKVAIARHGKKDEGYRYHILTVRPPGSKPGTKGVPMETMPRHVCRGHFAEYGPQYGKGKLFGKLEGRFFIPPHMKGKKENGIVEKDYLVPA